MLVNKAYKIVGFADERDGEPLLLWSHLKASQHIGNACVLWLIFISRQNEEYGVWSWITRHSIEDSDPFVSWSFLHTSDPKKVGKA